MDGCAVHAFGGFHQHFAQGGVGVDIIRDLMRGHFHALRQG